MSIDSSGLRQRTRARESALRVLYAVDVMTAGHISSFRILPGPDAETVQDNTARLIERFEYIARDEDNEWPEADAATRKFSNEIVSGVISSRIKIDALICAAADNWHLKRMPMLDRNIIRIATWELLHQTQTPAKVVINEAIELAKRYGSADAGPFVNGVLDRIKKDLPTSDQRKLDS